MHRRVTPLMDGLICATEYLADIYSDYNDNIWVCPNSIDPADWQHERPESDGIFRIVYYGSRSHIVDAPIITKALKWASRQPNVEVWTIGFSKPDWSFQHRTLPWSDMDKARANLFRFDLGVAPLKGNHWSRGKSDIKALEYSMAGALPLMSRETPFEPWFDVWPELTLEDGEWLDKIKYWVQNRDSVPEVVGWVKDWVLETRSIEKTIDNWRLALDA